MAQASTELQALASGDFGVLAQRFSSAGYTVALPAPGMLQITSAITGQRASVLLSVGVHGDETGPIEVLAQLLGALSRQPLQLGVDLMVCVGNIGAIKAGRRFIDADLNRMFRPVRGDLAGAVEAARADAIIAATSAFFNHATAERWHLDLHTAIRASKFPTFAIVPDLIAPAGKAAVTGWLDQAGIEAIILNPTSSGTYSHFSAQHCGAASATVELGRVALLGQNDLTQFASATLALSALLRGALAAAPIAATSAGHRHGYKQAQLFVVAQQITKQSDAFSMAFDGTTQNFTALPAGAVIATDGDIVHRVGPVEELVVFPNPNVRVGLRAALMVVRQG